jgi:hypothetical protein
VNGLNSILLISAIVAFTAAASSFVLIRERDFVTAVATAEQEDQPPERPAITAGASSSRAGRVTRHPRAALRAGAGRERSC